MALFWLAFGCAPGEDDPVEVTVAEHHCDLWAAGCLCTLRHGWRGWEVEQCFQAWVA